MSVDQLGDPAGWPVFLLQGGAADAARPPLEQAAARLAVRVIAIGEPGCGRCWEASSVEAVMTLADELGLERFGVVGCGTGEDVACAAAAAFPVRVTACVRAPAPPESDGVLDAYWSRVLAAARP